MSEDWIKFHRDLTRGKWVGWPRSHRFVLMELSLLCKPRDGECELPPPKGRAKDAVGRCVAMLGGDRREARRAIRALASDGDPADDGNLPTLLFETPDGSRMGASSSPVGRLLVVIPGWVRRNSRSKSGERWANKRIRDKEKRALEKKCHGAGDETEERRGEESRSLRGGEAPAQLSLTPDEPKPDKKPKRPAVSTIGWRVWRELWGAKHDATYVDAPGEGKAMQQLAKAAVGHAEGREGDRDEVVEGILRHWVGCYLEDQGGNGYLASERHPLRAMGNSLNKYGLPWEPRPTLPTVEPRGRPLYGPEAVRAREEREAEAYKGVSNEEWMRDD